MIAFLLALRSIDSIDVIAPSRVSAQPERSEIRVGGAAVIGRPGFRAARSSGLHFADVAASTWHLWL